MLLFFMLFGYLLSINLIFVFVTARAEAQGVGLFPPSYRERSNSWGQAALTVFFALEDNHNF